MKTLTLKLPEILEAKLNNLSRNNGLSKSEIIRRALTEYISRDKMHNTGSFLDLAKDLAGSVDGPSDLSSNKDYFKEYGK